MEEIKNCPYCGEHDIRKDGDTYHCNSCECGFTEDDFEHEITRQKISCVCSGEEATEEKPIDCTVNGKMLVIGEDNGQRVTSVFQDYEGIVWANLEGCEEPIEVDMLSTSDLHSIIQFLEENYGDVVATDYFWCYYKH